MSKIELPLNRRSGTRQVRCHAPPSARCRFVTEPVLNREQGTLLSCARRRSLFEREHRRIRTNPLARPPRVVALTRGHV
jgi:hypothetical protein